LHDSEYLITLFGDTIVTSLTAEYKSIQFSVVDDQTTIRISNITLDDAGVYMSRLRDNQEVLSSVVLVVTGKLFLRHLCALNYSHFIATQIDNYLKIHLKYVRS